MKKLLVISICLVFIVLFFLIKTSFFLGPSIQMGYEPPQRLKGTSVIDYGKIPLYWEKKLMEKIALEVSLEKDYELHVYDCTQFSKKLIRELRKEGFKARCTAGSNFDFEYSDHTWVSVFLNDTRIEVEATGGYIIDEEDFESYEIKWEDRCW